MNVWSLRSRTWKNDPRFAHMLIGLPHKKPYEYLEYNEILYRAGEAAFGTVEDVVVVYNKTTHKVNLLFVTNKTVPDDQILHYARGIILKHTPFILYALKDMINNNKSKIRLEQKLRELETAIRETRERLSTKNYPDYSVIIEVFDASTSEDHKEKRNAFL